MERLVRNDEFHFWPAEHEIFAPEIIGTWIYDFCNEGEKELVNLQLSLEIKQVNSFRVLETDLWEHKIQESAEGRSHWGEWATQKSRRRDHFRKEGRVSVSEAAEGSGQVG